MTSDVRLKHLFLSPTGGWCNRLRAIASARRLCSLIDAELTVVWDWGNFHHFFSECPDLKLISSDTLVSSNTPEIRQFPTQRSVDLQQERIHLHSCYVFWGSHESQIQLKDVGAFLPRLSSSLEARTQQFAQASLQSAIGLHMRRTDQQKSIQHSPDDLFISAAWKEIENGKLIFLSTDNRKTEEMMRKIFGHGLITSSKRSALEERWPRDFDQVAAEDDLSEIFLLSKTEYVLGSYWSSFSEMAIYLNGSPKSRILKIPTPPPKPMLKNGGKAVK